MCIYIYIYSYLLIRRLINETAVTNCATEFNNFMSNFLCNKHFLQ